MIYVDQTKEVSIKLNDEIFKINDDENYRKFLVAITNPDPSFDFDADAFAPDPSLEGDLAEIADRYSSFLGEFAERRREKVQELENEEIQQEASQASANTSEGNAAS